MNSKFDTAIRLPFRRLLAGAALCALLAAGASVFASDQIATTFPPAVQGNVTGVAVDSGGNQYICGAFSGSNVDFNPGLGSDIKNCLGMTSTFVTCIGSNSTYRWTQIFGGSTGDDEPTGIATDGTHVWVTGFFSSSDAGIGALGTFAPTGSDDVYVISLSAIDGSPNTSFGTNGMLKAGGSLRDRPTCMRLSGQNLYVAGSFMSTDFGIGGAGTVSAVSGAENTFVFVINAASGTAVGGFGTNGVQKFGGSVSDVANAVLVNAGIVYLAGGFTSSDAKIGGGTATVASSGGLDGFVLALQISDGSGVTAFGNNGVQKFGGSADDIANGITTDGTNIYVAGYTNSANFGTGGLGGISKIGNRSAFVLGLNLNNGAALASFGNGGVTLFGGSASDEAHDVLYAGTYLYVTGSLSSTNAGFNGVGTVSTSGGLDAFVFALAPNGAPVVPTFGGVGNASVQIYGGSGDESGDHLAAFGNSTVFMAGNANSTDAGLGGPGFNDHSIFGGVLLPLDSFRGQAEFPVLSGPFHAAGGLFSPFTYTISSQPAASSYSAGALPPGLSFNANGQITGNPTVPGTYDVAITATSGFGGNLITASADLIIDIVGDDIASSNPPIVRGQVSGLAIDASGNRYVCGSFSGTADFNPGVGSDVKVSQGGQAAFVTCYSSNNTYMWTQTFGGTGSALANGIATAAGGVYVVGSFSGTHAGFGGSGPAAALGQQTAFIFQLSATDGSPVAGFGTNGLVRFGGANLESGIAVAVSGSTVYATGILTSPTAGINGAATVSNKGTGLSSDVFILALDHLSGAAVAGFGTSGTQTFGGSGFDEPTGIAVSATGVYVTGTFDSNNAVIGVGSGTAAANFEDAFVIGLSPSTGAALGGFGSNGVQKLGGSGNDLGGGIFVSGTTLYLTGQIASSDFGIGASGSVASRGGSDAFIAALDAASGAAIAGFGSGGIQTFGGSFSEAGNAIDVANGVVYVAGTFSSSDAGIGGATIGGRFGCE